MNTNTNDQTFECHAVSPSPPPSMRQQIVDRVSPHGLLRQRYGYPVLPIMSTSFAPESRVQDMPGYHETISTRNFAVEQPHRIVTPLSSPTIDRKRVEEGSRSQYSKKRCVARSANEKKPQRPLSAYNLFFRDERLKIVGSRRKERGPTSPRFADIARIIAPRWKALDKDTREKYESLAMEERKSYFIAFEKWEQAREHKRLATRYHRYSSCGEDPSLCLYARPMSPVVSESAVIEPTPLSPSPMNGDDHQPLIDDEEMNLFLSSIDLS